MENTVPEPYEERLRRGGAFAVREAGRFFTGDDPVHQALRTITQRLTELGVDHAVGGGLAVSAHGYRRTTEDVDLIVTAEGLRTVHEHLVGLGYRPLFEGSKRLRDTKEGVRVEFLVTGDYPGDGKPKSIAFPDPSHVSETIDGIRYLSLPKLIELKLVSGMSGSDRLKDLADVQELIRYRGLSDTFAEKLHEDVREKYLELRRGVEDAKRP